MKVVNCWCIGGEASNCEINQGGVFMLAGKASDTLLAGGTMNNLGGEDSDTIVENGSIYRLGTDGLQLYSSGKTQNLSVNVGVGLKCMPVRWKMR